MHLVLYGILLFTFVYILFACAMKLLIFLILPCFGLLSALPSAEKLPTVVISILVRNKAHTLPYFLTLLESQVYDKKRLSLQIVSDHNKDASVDILNTWLSHVGDLYHKVNFTHEDDEKTFPDEKGPADWSELRMSHLINLREAALDMARNEWADYLWLLDADVFLTNTQTLLYLVHQNKTLLAPMLKSNGFYSNFWCGMTEDYYYTRTDEYKPILKRENQGCFSVPMIHSATLVNLRRTKTDNLTFIAKKVQQYHGPTDDIITLAVAANKSGIPLYICNEQDFGFIMTPMDINDDLAREIEQFTNLKLEALATEPPFPVSTILRKFLIPPMQYDVGVDVTYVINLRRRRERRQRMEDCLYELGMAAEFVDAVDGRTLNEAQIRQLGIVQMPEYKDPYHHRPITTGEIGCFLSHHRIWQNVVEGGKGIAMVLEDDVRFEPFFQRKVFALLEEMKKINLKWDLVYLGRKRLKDDEDWVTGSTFLVHPGYSYWTLGYLISYNGARKLLSQDPLSKLVPVDEYLPIMFDRHPEEKWKAHFPKRDLKAFSVSPLLLFPTHYTGQAGYISDTEDSTTVASSVFLKEDL